MSTITKERVAQFIKNPLDNGLTRGEQMELARIALASLEAERIAEPVAKVETVGVCWYADNGVPRKPAVGTELYAAPPSPVSVPAAYEHTEDFSEYHEGWNACRAAMLQGADGNSPVIPDGWVACSERMPEVGVKVLCFPVNDEPIHATYNGQLWLQDISWSTSDEPIDNVISCNVFHWMPMPAAPQQECKHEFVYGWHSYGSKSGYQCRFCGKLQEEK